VAEVIRREFGVAYHPDHVSRLLRECGWSLQKPLRRASQRDEEAIAAWVKDHWPEVKKTITEGYTLVWVDESGFYLLPAVLRTYAPVGKTPIIRSLLTNDHLSAISGITPAGQLYMRVQEQAIDSDDVIGFLQHLLRHIPGKLLILWDSSPTQQKDPSVSGQRRDSAHPPGTTARLRAGTEPG
jgi:hypothetical protein